MCKHSNCTTWIDKFPEWDREKKKEISYNARSSVYLLNSPLSYLPTNQLPSNRSVLRYYLFLTSARDKRFKPIKINFSCSRAREDVICKGKDEFCNSNTEKYCLLRQIVNIWKSAGFSNYLISERSIVEKFKSLYSKYKTLCNSKTFQIKKQISERHKNDFYNMVQQLFDISAKDFEMKLRRNESMPRDTSALQKDLAFLDDQRTNRNMIISSKIDTELEARFQRKIDRCKRKEEYKDRVQKSNDSIIRDNKEKIGEKRQWNHNFFPNNDINFNFASEEPTEPKKQKEEGQIRNEYINLMANKMLVLHFDGKILKHIEEDTRQATTADRLSVSVTSPEFETKDDLLLGVVPTDSGKGIDMAVSIMNLLEYFEICDYIVGFCSDTTVSNTGWKSGAITIMARFLGKPFLWLLCRHHIAEINITWTLKAISMEMSKAPANKLLKDFQQK
nr:uncharacterized protein LOC124815046 [Hydra vulgaris]